MRRKILRIFIYLIFLVIMLFVFVNLDILVGKFVRIATNDLRVVDFRAYEAMAKDTVYKECISIQFKSDDFETLNLLGACCVYTEQENLNKTITVLFKSEDICYASERRSVLGEAPAGILSPLGNSHGYTRDISLLLMKNGVYELWLFDWENEENYGLASLDIRIIKDKNGARIQEQTVTLNIEKELHSEADWCLDCVNEEGKGNLSFEGWAFQEDTETQGQAVYLKLTTAQETRYIECTSVPSRAVSLFFGNEKYDYSRFKGYADRTWIGDGPLEISLVLKNENGFHAGNKIYYWNPAAEKILCSSHVEIIKYPLFQTCPFNPDKAQPAFGFLDLVQKDDGKVYFTGWIAAKDRESKTQEVYLEIQTENSPYYVKCTQEVRTGVGDVMGNRLYDYSGYACQIKTEDIPIEGVSFRIFICNEGQVYTDGQSHYFDIYTGEYS